jgi:uncharacterized surface protein with fasciclin (FAS1) repeats
MQSRVPLKDRLDRSQRPLSRPLSLVVSIVGQTCSAWSSQSEIYGVKNMKFEIANLAAAAAAVIGLAVGSSNVHAAEKDIVDTAVAAGQFKTLAAALGAAGLVETLKGPGPFTVFAPTDDAFAKLPAGTVANLLKPENKDKLTAILAYHVVPGKVMAADVVKLNDAKTVNGKMLKITVKGNTVMINDAKVTTTDIVASNGVIHIIDTVVLPPAT